MLEPNAGGVAPNAGAADCALPLKAPVVPRPEPNAGAGFELKVEPAPKTVGVVAAVGCEAWAPNLNKPELDVEDSVF